MTSSPTPIVQGDRVQAAVMDIRTLVDEHYAAVYRYAFWLSGSEADGADLTQETYCCAQQRLGELRCAAAARSWMYAILRNCYRRRLRERRGFTTTSLDELPEEPAAPVDSVLEIDTEQLNRSLGELAPEFRAAIVLYYYEGLSYREIADELGIPIGTVMSRLARGKAHLRASLCAEPV